MINEERDAGQVAVPQPGCSYNAEQVAVPQPGCSYADQGVAVDLCAERVADSDVVVLYDTSVNNVQSQLSTPPRLQVAASQPPYNPSGEWFVDYTVGFEPPSEPIAPRDAVLKGIGAVSDLHHEGLLKITPAYKIAFESSRFDENRLCLVQGNMSEMLMTVLLDLIRGQLVKITEENFLVALEGCNMYLITGLQIYLKFYLNRTMTVENCLQYLHHTNINMLNDLKNDVFHYCCRNFKFIQNDLQIVNDELIEEFLRSDLLNVDCEDDVLDFLFSSRRVNTKRMAELIPLIRVEVLSNCRLDFLLQQKELVPAGSQVQARILNALHLRNSPHYATQYQNLHRYAKIRPVFTGFGGYSDDNAQVRSMEGLILGEFSWSNMLPERVQPGRNIWPRFAMSPFFQGVDLAAVTWNERAIYAIGRDYSCYRYKYRSNKWRSMIENLPKSSSAYGVAMWEGRIYVTGLDDDESLTLHVFNTTRKKGWRAFEKLEKTPRSHHCLVAAHGYLYLIGGYEDMSVHRASANMFRYNIIGQVWEEMPAMQQPRARMVAAVVGHVIYVFGGVHEHEEYRTCEKYNIITRRWESVMDMDHSRSSFSAVPYGGRIYCFGGENNKRILSAVDMYSPSTGRWHSLPAMTLPRRNLGAAVLLLPEENPAAI